MDYAGGFVMTIADKGPAPNSPAPAAIILRGSELKSNPIQWLWPNRIARGKLTLLAGAPASGKSTLATTVMAAITTGGAFPCGEGRAPEGSALMVCPHGDPDVLLPRLKAAGADLARIQLIREVPGPKGPRPFDVATICPCSMPPSAASRSAGDHHRRLHAADPASGRRAGSPPSQVARRAGGESCRFHHAGDATRQSRSLRR